MDFELTPEPGAQAAAVLGPLDRGRPLARAGAASPGLAGPRA